MHDILSIHANEFKNLFSDFILEISFARNLSLYRIGLQQATLKDAIHISRK